MTITMRLNGRTVGAFLVELESDKIYKDIERKRDENCNLLRIGDK